MSSTRTRSLALYLIAVIVVASTATAFVQSYEGLHGWASRYLSEGWARTWPLQVDAWIAVGELALYVAYRDRWPARRRIWPWLAALTGLATSTGFNVGHLADADLAGQLTAAVPPVAAFGGLFLGLQVLKHVEDDREKGAVAAVPDRFVLTGLRLAGLCVAADRMTAGRIPSDRTWPADGRAHPVAANGPVNSPGSPPTSVRRPRRDSRVEARAIGILAVEPDITGTELARRLGVAERTGRRLVARLRPIAPASS